MKLFYYNLLGAFAVNSSTGSLRTKIDQFSRVRELTHYTREWVADNVVSGKISNNLKLKIFKSGKSKFAFHRIW
jgi:hypothetical protein